jgi:hypothetical protein
LYLIENDGIKSFLERELELQLVILLNVPITPIVYHSVFRKC